MIWWRDYTCLFVRTIRLVFISPKKIILTVWGKTRACIILFSWTILIFLTTGFLYLQKNGHRYEFSFYYQNVPILVGAPLLRKSSTILKLVYLLQPNKDFLLLACKSITTLSIETNASKK